MKNMYIDNDRIRNNSLKNREISAKSVRRLTKHHFENKMKEQIPNIVKKIYLEKNKGLIRLKG